MDDLSHWDAAEKFSGNEAAALAIGLDPLGSQELLKECNPMLDRMKEGHRIARIALHFPIQPNEFMRQRKYWADGLFSVFFDSYPILYQPPTLGNPHLDFELTRRISGPDGEFEVQCFTRNEINRWLLELGLSSEYEF